MTADARDDRTLVQQCLTTTGSEASRQTADRLLSRIVRRRNFAVHRHVHLVAAFETARHLEPITSAMSAGCGAGLSELFLAAANPDVSFRLTDFDPVRLDIARGIGEAWGLENVSYEPLDLLLDPDGRTFDFVSSIEVLEHIDHDHVAARNLRSYAKRFAYILVPYCSPSELHNERRRAYVWEKFEHFRPGYTHETFAEIAGAGPTEFSRNCYFMPEAYEFRERVKQLTDDHLVANVRDIVSEVVLDVRDEVVDGGTQEAQGIEVLVRTGTVPPAR